MRFLIKSKLDSTSVLYLLLILRNRVIHSKTCFESIFPIPAVLITPKTIYLFIKPSLYGIFGVLAGSCIDIPHLPKFSRNLNFFLCIVYLQLH